MKWEDKELNYENNHMFPEVLIAHFGVISLAEKKKRKYLHVDHEILQDYLECEKLGEKAKGTTIERLCLYSRLSCRLAPGDENYPSLGVMHYWCDKKSMYAIFYIDPANTWLDVMVVQGENPNK